MKQAIAWVEEMNVNKLPRQFRYYVTGPDIPSLLTL